MLRIGDRVMRIGCDQSHLRASSLVTKRWLPAAAATTDGGTGPYSRLPIAARGKNSGNTLVIRAVLSLTYENWNFAA